MVVRSQPFPTPKTLLVESGRNHSTGAAGADNCGFLSRDVVWSGCELVVNGNSLPTTPGEQSEE